jgi:hypothetical protein
MSRQTLISGANQLVSSPSRLRALFTKCDDNFTELYNTVLVNVNIPAHASKTVYNIFTADQTYTVKSIRVTPDVVQGGTLTATISKATGTATPASGTTPLHTGTANLNATAHTVQTLTLTSTTADLSLAVGDRIGLILSGALSTGSANVTIRLGKA